MTSSGTDVTIREATESDRPQLRRMVLQLHETLRPLSEDLAPGTEILDAYWAHLEEWSSANQGAVFVAESGDGLIGYAWIFGLVPPEGPDEFDEKYTFVSDLFVDPAHQRGGVGAALMEHVERRARALGASRIDLDVLPANSSAIEFYRRLGFEPRVINMTRRLRDP